MSNESGIRPLDLKVLLLPEKTEEVTKGGVYLPDAVKDKEKFAAVRAKLIAVGQNAFREWGAGAAPKIGSTVMTAQYAGLRQKGADGQDYVLCNDSDVIGVLEEAE